MSGLNNKQEDNEENLTILKKVIENSYQRKQLKEIIERVFSKAFKMMNSSNFDGDEFENLKREFSILKNNINIS